MDNEVYQVWKGLNPTERYCTLLEIWLLRGHPEIIGERGGSWFRIPETFTRTWQWFFVRIPDEGLPIAGDKGAEDSLRYTPGWHNLGLLELFGPVSVRQGPPEPGKGWRIEWAVSLLRDLAEVYLSASDLDTGLRMFTTLLHHDPADIRTYNVMAISFDGFGLTEVGAEATRRGLELLDAHGDPENLHAQLNGCLERMRTSKRRGREAEVTPTVLAEVCAALALDFDGGKPRTPKALCRQLVPDLDKMPVKRPI